VPPETDQQAAQDALAAASRIGSTDGVEALLHPGAGEPTSPS